MADTAPQKPIHSLILDTGPLIKNAVSISTLVNSAEEIFTTSAIISEIRDEATRSRVQTTLVPFLKVRNPSPASYDAVVAFSKKTGDFAALSRQDLGVLALAHEVHCERNGGPWGLREAPKQPVKVRPGEEPVSLEDEEKQEQDEEPKQETEEAIAQEPEKKSGTKPKRPHKKKEKKRLAKALESETGKQSETEQQGVSVQATAGEQTEATEEVPATQTSTPEASVGQGQSSAEVAEPGLEAAIIEPYSHDKTGQEVEQVTSTDTERMTTEAKSVSEALGEPSVPESEATPSATQEKSADEHVVQAESHPVESSKHDGDLAQDLSTLNISTPPSPPDTDDDSSDGDWITPSNLSSHQAADAGLPTPSDPSTPLPQLDVATMTTDFAMQNVLLQMNLSLLSPNMQRIKTLTSKVLRCHACFLIERDTTKHFCPRCGGASLLRVNCSTNARGEFRLHLAKNYTYNKRGDKYSIPKPIAGTANGKWNGIGGGKGGWGRDLVLAEDQKEYVAKMEDKKKQARDMMDEDYLPGLLTGDRSGRAGGRVKVGAGKNVNSKKRF